MNTLILFYSLGGATKKEAELIALENPGSVLIEIKEMRRRNPFTAFIPGIIQAAKRKTVKIQPVETEASLFDRFIIGCPIWAGHPAPAWNSIITLIPEGKDVELFFCSESGDSSLTKDATCGIITSKGCNLISYRDIKTGSK